jgi:hypothetical protein
VCLCGDAIIVPIILQLFFSEMFVRKITIFFCEVRLFLQETFGFLQESA